MDDCSSISCAYSERSLQVVAPAICTARYSRQHVPDSCALLVAPGPPGSRGQLRAVEAIFVRLLLRLVHTSPTNPPYRGGVPQTANNGLVGQSNFGPDGVASVVSIFLTGLVCLVGIVTALEQQKASHRAKWRASNIEDNGKKKKRERERERERESRKSP
ncbi:uncharacterized protein UV8b_03664 [Ustilaginoidea virens]|uniref:Uncharacterized protein n=1 Tax=Ustilaginoidea virens TaxID=1159556 RepID=A0A8E5HQ73_USTVR|nr:uncharacterized protein UV8b_03664 [Ustilaginoidea virens]QUC19423.1 hypothetical protein UV8b_03664 [Ustilaginoidea virens]